MSRELTAGLESETLADQLTPILFAEFEFSGGTVNFWTGFGDFSWDGKVWNGTGYFGGVSAIQEASGMRATGANFVLSGIPAEVISIALGEEYQGRPARLWFAALDSDAKLIDAPYKIFEGRMDIMEMAEAGELANITMSAESELIDLERAREFRYTPEDQSIYFPGDTGFDMVSQLQDANISWGRGGLQEVFVPPEQIRWGDSGSDR